MTRLGVVLGELDQHLPFGVVVGSDVRCGEVGVVVVVVDAVDGTLALAGAAWIPADHVEVVGDLVAEPAGGPQRQRGAIGTRATAVGQQRSCRCVRRGAVTSDVQIDRVALRVGVVDGHRDRALIDTIGELRPLDRVLEGFDRLDGRRRLGNGGDDRIGDAGDVARRPPAVRWMPPEHAASIPATNTVRAVRRIGSIVWAIRRRRQADEIQNFGS